MKVCATIDLDDYEDYARLLAPDRGGPDPSTLSFYDEAIPRFLDLFDRHGTRATFFVVGRDAANGTRARRVREIAERGHEVGNHSYSHPYNFRALSRAEKAAEIVQAEAAISDAVGERPVGFRTPSCDVDLETLELLEERGYLYDSSVFPSPIMWAFMLYGKLFVKHENYQLGHPLAALAPREPYFPGFEQIHRRRAPSDARSPRILEVPFSVLPGTRFPFYNTLLRRLGTRFFDAMLRAFGTREPLLHLVFHMIEMAEFGETELGRSYGRTPGLAVPLAARERFIAHVVESGARSAEPVTLREFAASYAA